MSHRIFITGSGIADEAKALLRREDCTFQLGDAMDTPADISEKLQAFDPDGLIVRQGKITREAQESAKNLLVICKHGVGVDNIDIDSATKRNIPVMFTPMANYESVAEHTLALLLSLIRRIPNQDKRIRDGIFEKKNYAGLELFGKTLGLVGVGRVGKRLIELITPFHVNVFVFDPYAQAEFPSFVSHVKTIDPLFEKSDVISLHCPLTPETTGLVNAQTIARMKKGVFLVNTARGGIIHEKDLTVALQSGQVAGAALDTFETEPLPRDNALAGMENVVMTTHIAGVSDNSFRNMGVQAVQNVLSVLRDGPIDMACVINRVTLTN